MRYTLALAALSSIAAATPSPVAAPAPQGVTASLFPSSTPSSCSPTYMNGDYFQIGLIDPSSSSLSKRQVGPGQNPNKLPGNILLLSLQNGKLTDGINRTGYIASNGQLQFDIIPQSDAIITRGFSACPNDTLALGSAAWYSCGSGQFSNLYDRSLGDYCNQINLAIYLYTMDVSSAIAGIGAATMTGASSSASATEMAATTTTASTSGSGSGMMTSASATGASRTTSTARETVTAMATTTGATDGNAAPINSAGGSLGALVALVGLMAFML